MKAGTKAIAGEEVDVVWEMTEEHTTFKLKYKLEKHRCVDLVTMLLMGNLSGVVFIYKQY